MEIQALLQNFESEKLAHKICAKNAQNCAKFSKMPKIAKNKAKTFNKTHEEKKYWHSCEKLAHVVRPLRPSFSI